MRAQIKNIFLPLGRKPAWADFEKLAKEYPPTAIAKAMAEQMEFTKEETLLVCLLGLADFNAHLLQRMEKTSDAAVAVMEKMEKFMDALNNKEETPCH